MSPAPTPETVDLAEPLRSRWSPSVFDAEHVLSPEDLERVLHAGQWAPSAGNLQPWSYLVLLRGSPGHTVLVSHLSRGNAGWVPRASAVILAGTTVAVDPQAGPDAKPIDPLASHYDLGQSVAHLTLQAHGLGLFAHQFAGFDRAATARDLGVPEQVRIAAGIALGVRGDPAEVTERDRDREHRPRVRSGLSDLVHVDRWGGPWSRSPR